MSVLSPPLPKCWFETACRILDRKQSAAGGFIEVQFLRRWTAEKLRVTSLSPLCSSLASKKRDPGADLMKKWNMSLVLWRVQLWYQKPDTEVCENRSQNGILCLRWWIWILADRPCLAAWIRMASMRIPSANCSANTYLLAERFFCRIMRCCIKQYYD